MYNPFNNELRASTIIDRYEKSFDTILDNCSSKKYDRLTYIHAIYPY